MLPVRVYYEDTDFSGVVYHASYLRFLERGRTDFLRLAGVDQSTLHADEGRADLRGPAHDHRFSETRAHGDVLVVDTRTREGAGASLVIAQAIRRGTETILEADVRVAVLARERTARIPGFAARHSCRDQWSGFVTKP